MNHSARCSLALAALLVVHATGADAAVIVSFQPAVVNVEVGQTAVISLVATIPNETPVVGWGLHVGLDNGAILQLPGSGALNLAAWLPAGMAANFPVANPSERIAAVAFPTPRTGTVTLATFSFVATANGTTLITPYDNRLLNPLAADNTEGFALIPPKGFAQVTYVPGRINVPSPGAGFIAAWCGMAWAARRRRS